MKTIRFTEGDEPADNNGRRKMSKPCWEKEQKEA